MPEHSKIKIKIILLLILQFYFPAQYFHFLLFICLMVARRLYTCEKGEFSFFAFFTFLVYLACIAFIHLFLPVTFSTSSFLRTSTTSICPYKTYIVWIIWKHLLHSNALHQYYYFCCCYRCFVIVVYFGVLQYKKEEKKINDDRNVMGLSLAMYVWACAFSVCVHLCYILDHE